MTAANEQAFVAAKRAVIAAGAGRGFIVAKGFERYVITAAHCLPHYPEPHVAKSTSELTYPRILGPLASDQRPIWAELVFCSAVDDLAVFGEPEAGYDVSDEDDPYMDFQTFTKDAMQIGNHLILRRAKKRVAAPELSCFRLSSNGIPASSTTEPGASCGSAAASPSTAACQDRRSLTAMGRQSG
jgi:hypothetical protein